MKEKEEKRAEKRIEQKRSKEHRSLPLYLKHSNTLQYYLPIYALFLHMFYSHRVLHLKFSMLFLSPSCLLCNPYTCNG
jgi:hypothetical protein